MKLNYILDTFESLVCEIKNSKSSLDQDATDTLQDNGFDNAVIYCITFCEENGEITYTSSSPINKLHPCALEIPFNNFEVPAEYQKFIDPIVSKLQIKPFSKEYYWKNTPNRTQLHIKVHPKPEKETDAIRFFNYCFKILKNELELIENGIKAKVLKCKTSEQTTQFIHKNQHALDQFISKLIKRINPNSVADLYAISNNYDRLDCLKLAYIFAEKILSFLEFEYTPSLNPNIKISNNTILKTQRELAYKCNFIKSKILAPKLNSELIQIANTPILKIDNNSINERLTNFEFNYCCRYVEKTFKQFKMHELELSNQFLSDWLLEINLNTMAFFDYLTDIFTSELKFCDTANQRLDTLYLMLKTLNQKPNKVSLKLKAKLPAIKQQLINWLEEEIDYLRKKMVLENNSASTTNEEIKIKLLSGLTVAQLSYFSNLLLKTEIIKHDNQSEVIQFMATNFKTNMTEKISPESFRSKYYNVEETTKHFVREKIIDLLNLTKS